MSLKSVGGTSAIFVGQANTLAESIINSIKENTFMILYLFTSIYITIVCALNIASSFERLIILRTAMEFGFICGRSSRKKGEGNGAIAQLRRFEP